MKISNPEITQRDLRFSSREIMDAVEHGQSFTVTRDGHPIGELISIPRRRFVSRQEFTAMSRNAPDLEAFRADQDKAADHDAGEGDSTRSASSRWRVPGARKRSS